MAFRRTPLSRLAAVRSPRHLVGAAVDLLFPPRCICCGMCVYAAELCDRCAASIGQERRVPACPRCAASVAPYEVSDGRCGKCRNRRPNIASTVRVGPYHVLAGNRENGVSGVSTLGRLVRAYKYRGREEIEPLLGGMLADTVADAPWLDRVEALVAVPTHWRHRIGRPLYAAETLASVVARRSGIPKLPILKRIRGGPHQIGLSLRMRTDNVLGAFAIRRGVTLDNARILLIDDVMTSGATLNECAKVLRRGGARELYGAVVVTVVWDRTLAHSRSTAEPPAI